MNDFEEGITAAMKLSHKSQYKSLRDTGWNKQSSPTSKG